MACIQELHIQTTSCSYKISTFQWSEESSSTHSWDLWHCNDVTIGPLSYVSFPCLQRLEWQLRVVSMVTESFNRALQCIFPATSPLELYSEIPDKLMVNLIHCIETRSSWQSAEFGNEQSCETITITCEHIQCMAPRKPCAPCMWNFRGQCIKCHSP